MILDENIMVLTENPCGPHYEPNEHIRYKTCGEAIVSLDPQVSIP